MIARIARADTMDGAYELGRVAHFVVENNRHRFDAWLKLMTEFMLEGIEKMTGKKPDTVIEPAPESERSGNA